LLLLCIIFLIHLIINRIHLRLIIGMIIFLLFYAPNTAFYVDHNPILIFIIKLTISSLYYFLQQFFYLNFIQIISHFSNKIKHQYNLKFSTFWNMDLIKKNYRELFIHIKDLYKLVESVQYLIWENLED